MLKKMTVGVSALAMMGFAGSAMAQANLIGSPATVDIDIIVEEVAELVVINSNATMIIDDTSDSFMGTTSTGSSFDAADLAVLQLNTNFDVSSIDITYDKVNNIRDFGAATWFGEAVLAGGSSANANEVLGVWPQAGILSGATGSIIGGGGGMAGNDASSDTIGVVRTNTGGGAFGNGSHYIGLGVSTNWDRVPASASNTFAAAGTYNIALTATIVP